MAQDNKKQQKNAKPAVSAAGKPAVRNPRDVQRRRVLWSDISKKFLLPASILMLAVGLFFAVYYVMMMTQQTADTESVVTTGMMVSGAILGLMLIIAGALGLLRKSHKVLNTLATLSIVYAIVLLTATAKTGAVAIASNIVVIVFSLFFIVAVDGMFDVGLVKYFREMFGETKKLTWLSGKDLVSHTLAVLVFVLAMAAMIYVLDLAFSSGFSALSSIKIG